MDEAFVLISQCSLDRLHSIGGVAFRQRERHDRMVEAIGDMRLVVIC